jgi:hypothetical protein
MESVADQLRAELRAAQTGRSLDERVSEVLSLGRRDARLLASARGLTRVDAVRQLARQRQRGRRLSRCHESLLA